MIKLIVACLLFSLRSKHMAINRLQKTFFARDTHVVAKELLGKVLVRQIDNKIIAGRIVEVEAYVGEDDLACHAARGRTPRTEIMFGEAGHAYIYLIYGMYHCLNIVTAEKDFPAAVLIRALEPIEGMEYMSAQRKTEKFHQLTSGPGKLCQALNITRAFNGIDVTNSEELFVQNDGFHVTAKDIETAPRIGVAYAGACALYPWRYYLKGNQFVSR